MLPRLLALGLVLAPALLTPTSAAPPAGPAALIDVRFLVVAGDAPDVARADAAAPALLAAFEAATGHRARLASAGPAAALHAPPGGPLHGAAPAVAREAFAAGLGADVLVLVAGPGVALTDPSCACVAWSQRARDPTGATGYDATRAFGAPATFVGVIGLASVRDLEDSGELEYRFLHEVGHMWCCRPAVAGAAPGLLADRGAHWAPDLDLGLAAGVRDPLAGDGSERARAGIAWRYSERTLATMGL